MSYQQFFKVMSLPQPPSFQQYNYICIKYCPVVLDHLMDSIKNCFNFTVLNIKHGMLLTLSNNQQGCFYNFFGKKP